MTPSVNPPGEEREVARICAMHLNKLGLDVKLDEFAPGRANVVAFAGDPDNLGLVLYGHLDCVPATGDWVHEPYSGVIENGFLWGRGSSDMKSGCAAIIEATDAAIRCGRPWKKGLCIALVADEERLNLGVKRIRDTTILRADACIVCEPTKLQVHLGNRGYTSFRIRASGLACHAGQPHNGINAIYRMGRVICELEDFSLRLAKRIHPQLGSMSLSVGTIHGGTQLNIVPDSCEIEVEVRVFPGFTAQDMQKELQALLGDAVSVVIRSDLPASYQQEDSDLVLAAANCVQAVTGIAPRVECFPACSEASFFSIGYCIPTILLGPGDISCAHKPDEQVDVQQITQAVEIYAMMIEKYCL